MAGNVVEMIDNWVRIDTALVSVSDKTGLDVLAKGLVEANPDVLILSTGGTYKKLQEILGETLAAKNLMPVSDYTGQPETQGGLVKTLDFKIYLGLLTETYNDSHQQDLERTQGRPIDLVAVNLYPFSETVAKDDVTVEKARANIDIGGPTMVRASAKNYLRVASVVDPSDYAPLVSMLKENGAKLNLEKRFEFARKAFAHTASYDTAISAYLAEQTFENVSGCYNDETTR